MSNQSSKSPRHPGDEMSPNPYCEAEPYQLRIWDQTALAGLMHCPRYHYLAQIRGLRAGGDTESVDLKFGSFIHEAADVYAKARGAGADCELATEFAVEHALSATWPEDGQPWGGSYRTVWQCPDRTRAKKATKSAPAEKRCTWSKAEHLVSVVPGLEQVDGVPGTLRECPECGKGARSRVAYIPTDKYKNRHTLLRSVVAMCDALSNSNIRPKVLADGRIGSEVRWLRELKVQSPDGTPYIMTGSFDGIEQLGEDETILKEIKTTKREPNQSFFTGLTTGVQVYTYSWAADCEFPEDHPEVWFLVVQIGTNFTEIIFKPAHFTKAQYAEWENEIGFWVSFAEDLAHAAKELEDRGQNPQAAFPRNLTACSSMPGASTTPCPFRDFCRLDPRNREGFLRTNFKVERWNPLGTKGTELTPADSA